MESYKIRGGGPLTCTLHTMHGTIFMLARSSDYRFHSRLAIFIQEGKITAAFYFFFVCVFLLSLP
jgi:hypothetical protein